MRLLVLLALAFSAYGHDRRYVSSSDYESYSRTRGWGMVWGWILLATFVGCVIYFFTQPCSSVRETKDDSNVGSRPARKQMEL